MDKQPEEADIHAYINKRMRDFAKLQGLIQHNLRDSSQDEYSKQPDILKDTNIMQKKKDMVQMDPSQLFSGADEVNIRQMLQFNVQPPRHLIQFRNKSEEESFMRLGHRIYTLHLQSKVEVIYTYQRVFKFLLETLNQTEFEQLSFYSVNRLIDTIFQTKI